TDLRQHDRIGVESRQLPDRPVRPLYMQRIDEQSQIVRLDARHTVERVLQGRDRRIGCELERQPNAMRRRGGGIGGKQPLETRNIGLEAADYDAPAPQRRDNLDSGQYGVQPDFRMYLIR